MFCVLLYKRINFKFLLDPNRNSSSHLGFSQNPLFVVNYFSSKPSSGGRQHQVNEKDQIFTVSYLVNSCGLSLDKAELASRNRKLHFDTPKRPDSVLNLLKNHGFTNDQITKLVRERPMLLLADPEKSLLPKLEFFSSIGLSHSDCSQIITTCPALLESSVKNHLKPCYDLLKSVLVLDENVIATLKRAGRGLGKHVDKNLAPNLALLREIRVPQSSICLFLKNYPTTLFIKHSKFVETVKKIKDMGFDPVKVVFIQAVHVLSGVRKANWERKFDVYRRWGWSKDETLSAFKKYPDCMVISENQIMKAMDIFVKKLGWSEDVTHLAFKKEPHCMFISEKKIMKAMDFCVNKMGLPSEAIARNPVVLLLSLEKTIIPRCSVVQILIFKGLIKEELRVATFSKLSENHFLERYVTKFQQEVPQLLDVYQGKVDLLDIGISSEKMCGSNLLKLVND